MVYTQIPLIPWKNMEKMFIIYLNGREKMAMGMVMIVAGSSEIQWAQQPTSPSILGSRGISRWLFKKETWQFLQKTGTLLGLTSWKHVVL